MRPYVDLIPGGGAEGVRVCMCVVGRYVCVCARARGIRAGGRHGFADVAYCAGENGETYIFSSQQKNKNIGAFDVDLGDFQAVGQIIDQVYKRIAYESIIGTARAAIAPR